MVERPDLESASRALHDDQLQGHRRSEPEVGSVRFQPGDEGPHDRLRAGPGAERSLPAPRMASALLDRLAGTLRASGGTRRHQVLGGIPDCDGRFRYERLQPLHRALLGGESGSARHQRSEHPAEHPADRHPAGRRPDHHRRRSPFALRGEHGTRHRGQLRGGERQEDGSSRRLLFERRRLRADGQGLRRPDDQARHARGQQRKLHEVTVFQGVLQQG